MTRREMLSITAGTSLAGAEERESGWIKSGKNPMLSLGKEGEFDSQNIMSPCVVKENGRYFLFYAGGPCGPANNAKFVRYQLGLALSTDGETWTKTGKPLLPLGERDNFHVTPALLRHPDATLCRQSGLWHMVYCGNREDDVEHATSPDGLRWTKDAEGPVYRRAYAPHLIQMDSEVRLYYIHKPGAGKGEKRPWEVHLATGRDLYSLKAHPANPVLTVSQEWESGTLFYPYVIREKKTWVMFYAAYWNHQRPGVKVNRTAIGMATSGDGVRWRKYAGNPILTPIAGSPYESVYNSSQSVIHDGDHYKMYYASRKDALHKYYAVCLARKRGRLVNL